MTTRIVLADDHALVREGLKGFFETRVPGTEVVGEASTGLETLEVCRKLQPDVLVLDISMPDLGGLEVLAELPSVSPKTRTIVVSQYSDRGYVMQALELGAKGYVPKKALGKDLAAALEAVTRGRTYLDPSVADVVVDAAIRPQGGADELDRLSPRERQVLKLTAEGRTARDVGQLLNLSPHTVNRHRANLMAKLGVHTRAELVKLAVRLGLVEL